MIFFGWWFTSESFSIASRFISLNWSHNISLIVRENWFNFNDDVDESQTERVKRFEFNIGIGKSHDKRLRLDEFDWIFNEEFDDDNEGDGDDDDDDDDGEWPSLDARFCLTGRNALCELPNCCFCRWWFKNILAGICIWLLGRLYIDGLIVCDLSRRTFLIKANSGKRRIGLFVLLVLVLFVSNEWRLIESSINKSLFRCFWLGFIESGILITDERRTVA